MNHTGVNVNHTGVNHHRLKAAGLERDSHPFTLYTVTTKTQNQSHAYLPVSFKTFSINININIWATMFHVKFQ